MQSDDATSAAARSSAPRRPSRALLLNGAAFVVLVAGYALAIGHVLGYEAHITRQQFIIPGAIPTPVIHLIPSARSGDAVAIIVHGYSGSKDLMIGFGIELAKAGIPSWLLDLPGHGSSTVPYDPHTVDHRNLQLEAALDEVVSYARMHSDVAQPRIILIGHSLGTLVVGEYALHQPTSAIAATILVSPILPDLPAPDHPANLGIIVGEQDIASLLPLSRKLFAAACSGEMIGVSHGPSDNFQSCGTPGSGTERRFAEIPGANHITILTDAHTYRQINRFIGSAFSDPAVLNAADPAQDDGRIAWALVGVLCAGAAILPLIALLALEMPLAATENPAPATARAIWGKLGIVAGAVIITVVVLRLWSWLADHIGAMGLRTPFTWLHMALADYTASFALVLALVLVGAHRLLRRPLALPSLGRWWGQALVAVMAGIALYLLAGTLATLAWERFVLNGPRGWRFIILFAAQLPLFAILVGMFGEDRSWRGLLAFLGAFLLLCCGYVGAIVLDSSLFFLSLLVPIEGLLFVAFALLGQAMQRGGKALGLASAMLMAGIFAWAVAAVFPIVQ